MAMENALDGADRITVLRPGAIYGLHRSVRDSFLVARIASGERTLRLPDGGHSSGIGSRSSAWHEPSRPR